MRIWLYRCFSKYGGAIFTNRYNNNNNNNNNFIYPGKKSRSADQIDPLVSTGDQQYKLRNIKVELTILEYNYYKEIQITNYK